MANIYILSQGEKFIKAFASLAELREYMLERIILDHSEKDGSIDVFLDDKYATNKYKAQKLTVGDVTPSPIDTPAADHYIAVESDADNRRIYRVGMDKYDNPISCECGDFQHRRKENGTMCKHMLRVEGYSWKKRV